MIASLRNYLLPGLVAILLAGMSAVLIPSGSPALAAPPSRALPDMVNEATLASIDKGLKFLASTQRGDGAWYSAGNMGTYPAAMTSLAGLALLSSGSTPQSGPYNREVRKAMLYILRVAEAGQGGLIAGPGGEGRTMYGHGFSMLFLAQCYGVDVSPEFSGRIRAVLDKAVDLTAKSQSDLGAQYKHAGGWIYTPDGKSDEGSVTVTQLQALRACRNVGIKVPRSTIERAVGYLQFCQNPDGGICYAARQRGESRPPISAAAIACFYAAGIYDRQSGGSGEEAEMVEKLVTFCKSHLLQDNRNGDGGYYFYTHFYMGQAMYQRGGKDWNEYYPKVRDRLISLQAADGSWNGDNGIGTTYGTAIALTVLQLPYGYLPIAQR